MDTKLQPKGTFFDEFVHIFYIKTSILRVYYNWFYQNYSIIFGGKKTPSGVYIALSQ